MSRDLLILSRFVGRLVAGTFDQDALLERAARADQRDEVGFVHGPPPGLCRLEELERHRDAGGLCAGPLGDPLPRRLGKVRPRSREFTTTGDEIQPANLRKSLPNYQYRVGNAANVVSFSDAVVLGTVTKVQKANGVIWRDDKDFTVVDYNDAKPDTRSALVTTAIDRASGAVEPTAQTVTFRVIAPAQADPEKFIEGLAGLQSIAVVLDKDPNAAETTPWRPILGDRLIGVVGAGGSLTLPTFADATAFEGTLDTEEALMAATGSPATIEQVPRPEIGRAQKHAPMSGRGPVVPGLWHMGESCRLRLRLTPGSKGVSWITRGV